MGCCFQNLQPDQVVDASDVQVEDLANRRVRRLLEWASPRRCCVSHQDVEVIFYFPDANNKLFNPFQDRKVNGEGDDIAFDLF